MENQRNVILAVVLTALILFGWQAGVDYLYPEANKPKPVAAAPASDAAAAPTREGGLTSASDIALEAKDLKTVLSTGGRVPVAGPGLSGSISLTGALIDDLTINRHTATIKKNSGPQRIFSPAGTPAQHFAQFGWVGAGLGMQTPGAETVWSAPAGARLTPETPVTLTWTNPTGQAFAIKLSIDKDYMITVDQSVANRGAAPVALQSFGLISRTE